MSDDIVIHHSRIRLLLLGIGALIFVIVGTILARSPEPTMIAIGWIGIGFFGCGLIYIALRFISPKPALVIGADGIHDHASGVGVGFIRWSEIVDVRRLTFMNKEFLGVFVTDPESVIRRQSFLRRHAVRANYRMVGTPITIPRIGLPISITKLQALIESQRTLRS